MISPTVSIIILNWNGWRDTIECLDSIKRIAYPNYNIIILDNGSRDGSIERIREHIENNTGKNLNVFKYESDEEPPRMIRCTHKSEHDLERELKIPYSKSEERLVLIRADKNYGFAEGNNIAMRCALGTFNSDYLLLLNNDTVVDKYFLDELIKIAISDDTFGFVGPKIYYYDFHGSKNYISSAGGKLNMWIGKSQLIGGDQDSWQYDEIRIVDFVEGACMLIKKDALNKIGFLDPRYFAYWEETDLCTRGARNGYKSVYAPKSKIWHKVSSSASNRMKIFYLTRNQIIFMKLHSTKIQYAVYILYFFAFAFWFKIFTYILYYNDFDKLYCFGKGILDGFSS